MEVKPGYKQTEVGVIPGEWEVKRLGGVGKCLRGVSYKGDSDLSTRDTPHTKRLLRSNNVQNAIVVTDEVQFVNVARVSSHQILQHDDILVCMANGSKALVGKAGIFTLSDGHEYTFGAFMGCFRTNSAEANPAYVFYLFLTARYRDYINNLLAGSSINNLRPSSIESLEFSTPPLPEQRAIATALSDVDGLLGGLDRLIAKKRDLKQAAMQQLLTGQTRLPGFHGEWVVKQLGSVADVLKGNALSKSLVSASGTRPCILYGELFTTYGRVISEIIARTNSSEGCLSVSGDLLMPGSTTTTGADLATASALLVDNVALGGDIIVIRRKDQGYDPIFMANYLTQAKRHEIAELTQGITIHHLYGKDVKTLSLRLPSLPEQTAIAEVLTEMDAELAVLEQRWEKTRALKQAMMQELLTGRTRLV